MGDAEKSMQRSSASYAPDDVANVLPPNRVDEKSAPPLGGRTDGALPYLKTKAWSKLQ